MILRGKSPVWRSLLAGLVASGTAAAAVPQAELPSVKPPAKERAAKPVLMMGPSYGKYERNALRRDVLEPGEITFEDGGDWTSAELWGNYSQVIVTQGFPALSDREVDWIRLYLNDGGQLLIMGPALSSLRALPAAQRDWLGAMAAGTVSEGEFSVSAAGKSLVPDAAAAQQIFGRPSDFAGAKLTSAIPLVTRGGQAVLFRNDYGNGQVWFFGTEYFRILSAEKIESQRLKASAPARRLLQNLVALGGAQKKSALVENGMRAYGGSLPVVWSRDFSEARGAAYSATPFPRRGEELRTIHLDLGMDEWESVPFYLSSAAERKTFSIALNDLLPEKTQPSSGADHPSAATKIAAADMRVRVQGVPDPALTVGPFWLLDLERTDQPGRSHFALPLAANSTSTVWITLRTHGVAPGTYRGPIQCDIPGLPALQMEVRVWPVRLPGHEYFAAEATSQWSSLLTLPGSKSDAFGPKLNLATFNRHVQNIAEHGVTANMDGSWADRLGHSFSLKNATLAGSPLSFEDAMRQGRIQEDHLPALDLSYFDPLVEPLLLRGVTDFDFVLKNLPSDWLVYAKSITGDPNLTPDSPRHEKIKRWLLGECTRYLHEKGIRNINTMIADEIPANQIPDVSRRAALLQEGGFKVGLTATGEIGRHADLIRQLNPAIDRWIWNMTILPQAKQFLSEDPHLIDAGDQQFTYLADWHRAPYVSNRAIGPFCAHYGLDGILFHGYLRWYPNGGAVFSSAAGPVDTEGWEGARDGVEDARYMRKLDALLQAASGIPAVQAEVETIKARLALGVSAAPDSSIRLEDRSYGTSHYLAPVSTYQSLQKFKVVLLQSLAALQDKVHLPVTATYDTLVLEKNDVTAATVTGTPEAVKALNDTLQAREIGSLPVTTGSGGAETPFSTRVLIGSPVTNLAIAKLVESGKIHLLTPPKPGSYQVHRSGADIVIYALDTPGAVEGARIFGQLVERAIRPLPLQPAVSPHDQN